MPFLAHYCFVATFGYVLLTEGYGFEPGRNLTVVNKIDGLKVTWALGAMLYEINALPWEYVRPQTWVAAFIGSFLLNVLLFAGVIFFLRKSHLSAAAIINRKRSMSTQSLSGLAAARKQGYGSIPSSTTTPGSGAGDAGWGGGGGGNGGGGGVWSVGPQV